MRPADTFDQVAELYDRVRPSYPDALFDILFEHLPPTPDIVEVGPGTGRATGPLLDRGAVVTAVEPGPNLAAVLEQHFGGRLLRIALDTLEDASLPDHSFDAVVSATAYHWVSPEAQLSRPAQVLRPDGVVATIDLLPIDDPADGGFHARVDPVFAAHGLAKNDPIRPFDLAVPHFLTTAQAAGADVVGVHRVRWDRTYATAHYADLLRTFSNLLLLPAERREAVIAELADIIETEFDGSVTRPLAAVLVLVRPPR